MEPIHIFISYSHEDSQWFKDGSLVPNLIKSLEFDGDIRVWYDKRALLGGDPWQEDIEAAIDCAHITILLVSRSFIASTFIRNVELPRIEARAQKKELIIIPILVGYCKWQSIASLSVPQMLPGGPTPLVEFLSGPAKWDKVQFDILNQVEQQIDKVRARRKEEEKTPKPIKPPEVRVAPTVPPALPTVETAIPPRAEVEKANPEPPVEGTLPPRIKVPLREEPRVPVQQAGRRTSVLAALGGVVVLVTGIGIGLWQRTPPDIADNPTPTTTGTPPATNSTPAPVTLSSFTEDLGNGVKLEMISVPGGTFLMGSSTSEPGDFNREEPQHQVTVASFAIGKYEVTQTQWQAVMGTSLRQQRDKENKDWGLRGEGDDYPMYYVSWEEAVEFCRKLSERTGKSYRLPTEAEWEYACRADTTGAYAGTLDELAWYSKNSGGKTHPIGQKKANAFGLYDMHGNVWEWCQDWFGSYTSTAVTDPQGPGSGNLRVFRGGGWISRATRCRSAFRYYEFPDARLSDVGVRILRTLIAVFKCVRPVWCACALAGQT